MAFATGEWGYTLSPVIFVSLLLSLSQQLLCIDSVFDKETFPKPQEKKRTSPICQMYRQTSAERERERDRQTDRQRQRQTHREKERQRQRQKERETDR